MAINFTFPKLKQSEQIKHWVYIVLGSLIMAVGFTLFISPYNIVPGGVYGIGISLHNIFPDIQVGTFGWLLDIPLLITSFLVFGGRVGAKTITAACLMPLFMNTPQWVWGPVNPVTEFIVAMNLGDDLIVSCIFGGVMIGLSMGLILKTHATSGGTDIIGMIISKYFKLPIAQAVLMIDVVVVVFGLIVIGDWKVPLYSLITIFVASKVMDFIIEGASGDKLLFILSDKHDEIKEFILGPMGRGGTYIKAAGMYTGAPREMVFVVISRRELSIVQDFVRKLDDDAFMIVVNAHETLGDGFKKFQERIGG